MKKMNTLCLALIATTAALGACTPRESDNQPSNPNVNQEPGTLGSTDSKVDTGSTEVKRDIVKHETKTEKIPTVESKNVRADINRMNTDDFVALGLPKPAADSLIKYRDDRGGFKSIDELRQVPGLDQAWLERNRSKLGYSTG